MRLLRDDGAVVYLNGVEVYRSNMPTGTIGHTTRASSPSATPRSWTWLTALLNPALLVAGDNVIAVEIHQDSPTSSDISFDLELTATAAAPASARRQQRGSEDEHEHVLNEADRGDQRAGVATSLRRHDAGQADEASSLRAYTVVIPRGCATPSPSAAGTRT